MILQNFISLDDITCLYHDPDFDPFYAPSTSRYLFPPSSLYSHYHLFPFHAPFPSLSPPTMLEASLVLPMIQYIT